MLKTIMIDGKGYVEVAERIKAFRQLHPQWSIETAILSNADGVVLMQAMVKDESGRIIATGHAFEKQDSNYVNRTSYIENCETSAVGRALGILGIGVDTAIASAEEVATAQANQPPQPGEARNGAGASLDTVLDRKAKIKLLQELVGHLTTEQKAAFKTQYPNGTKGLRDTGLTKLEKELREAIGQGQQQSEKAA
ncbi:MAG: hypothetical protein NTV22_01230 [bacterium]|nr:hypothetical protein [bacterium]